MLEDLRLRLGVERNAPMHLDILLAAEVLEVGNGEETDVRGVIPFVVQDPADFGARPVSASIFRSRW